MLFIFIVTYVSILLIFWNFRDRVKKPKPSRPWGFPVLGHLPLFGKFLPDTLDKWRRKCGNVFRIRMGTWDTVVINGYSAIKETLEKRGDTFSSRPFFIASRILTRDKEDCLGFGQITPAYILHRKLVTGALRVITNTQMKDT